MRIHLDSPIEILAFQSKTSAEYASKIFPNLKIFFARELKFIYYPTYCHNIIHILSRKNSVHLYN